MRKTTPVFLHFYRHRIIIYWLGSDPGKCIAAISFGESERRRTKFSSA